MCYILENVDVFKAYKLENDQFKRLFKLFRDVSCSGCCSDQST